MTSRNVDRAAPVTRHSLPRLGLVSDYFTERVSVVARRKWRVSKYCSYHMTVCMFNLESYCHTEVELRMINFPKCDNRATNYFNRMLIANFTQFYPTVWAFIVLTETLNTVFTALMLTLICNVIPLWVDRI
jgi:hypothetical protein